MLTEVDALAATVAEAEATVRLLMFFLVPVALVVFLSVVSLFFLWVSLSLLYLSVVSISVVLVRRRFGVADSAESRQDLATEGKMATKEDTAMERDTMVEVDRDAPTETFLLSKLLLPILLLILMFFGRGDGVGNRYWICDDEGVSGVDFVVVDIWVVIVIVIVFLLSVNLRT